MTTSLMIHPSWSIEVSGNPGEYDKVAISLRVRSMLEHHPELLAGHSVVFRYDDYRVFITPIPPEARLAGVA